MTAFRVALASFAALSFLSFAACRHQPRSVALDLDHRNFGGQKAQAKLEVPAGWYQESKKPTQAEFVGPDNFSRLSISASATQVNAEGCIALSAQRMNELAESLAKRASSPDEKPEVLERATTEDVVDLKLRLKGRNAPER